MADGGSSGLTLATIVGVAWVVAVVAVIGRAFAGLPNSIDDARGWWLHFAAPTALWSLMVGVPLGITIAFVVGRSRS